MSERMRVAHRLSLYLVRARNFLVALIPRSGTPNISSISACFMKRSFGYPFWDYSHLPLNLGGRVCLLFALFWGVLALLVLHVIHPAAAWLAARIPLWAFPPAVLATALDTLLTARLLRRTGDPNSLRWYARLPRRRPA